MTQTIGLNQFSAHTVFQTLSKNAEIKAKVKKINNSGFAFHINETIIRNSHSRFSMQQATVKLTELANKAVSYMAETSQYV